MKIRCSRCGLTMSAASEYEAEVQFSNHVCRDLRALKNMPTDLLTQVAEGGISEAAAWRLTDARKEA